eukprot:gene2588-3297_t
MVWASILVVDHVFWTFMWLVGSRSGEAVVNSLLIGSTSTLAIVVGRRTIRVISKKFFLIEKHGRDRTASDSLIAATPAGRSFGTFEKWEWHNRYTESQVLIRDADIRSDPEHSRNWIAAILAQDPFAQAASMVMVTVMLCSFIFISVSMCLLFVTDFVSNGPSITLAHEYFGPFWWGYLFYVPLSHTVLLFPKLFAPFVVNSFQKNVETKMAKGASLEAEIEQIANLHVWMRLSFWESIYITLNIIFLFFTFSLGYTIAVHGIEIYQVDVPGKDPHPMSYLGYLIGGSLLSAAMLHIVLFSLASVSH